ncbi:alanine:cation symporter family protein [Ectothiorhodospira shaposhnikovii]|uniref:alanine:cation symporter family protein n=1 Tax=Ectothiorhodospira shaposhnikovii TaxID=1054 RepID=UPI001F5BCB23|nr:alanine:cation symporter family protein [Ectothiorhodospira shaposhnikovii]
METGLGIPNWVTGIGVMLLVDAVTLGIIKRIAVTAERIVPTMALICVIGALDILISYYGQTRAELTTSAFSLGLPGLGGATLHRAVFLHHHADLEFLRGKELSEYAFGKRVIL